MKRFFLIQIVPLIVFTVITIPIIFLFNLGVFGGAIVLFGVAGAFL